MAEEKSKEASSWNTVYIGRQKPLMNYVLATLTCLNNSPNVTMKARGAAIGLAVDVAEITRQRFVSGVRIANIKIGTEQMESQEGGTRNVSTIEIELTTSEEQKSSS
jgi:DNA-binding protein